jgi:hypothetical protein
MDGPDSSYSAFAIHICITADFMDIISADWQTLKIKSAGLH